MLPPLHSIIIVYLCTLIHFVPVTESRFQFTNLDNDDTRTATKNISIKLPINHTHDICSPDHPQTFGLDFGFADCDTTVKKSLLKIHPDQYKKTDQILETYGYPYEEHKVKTEDGYILTVYRITGSPNLKEKQERDKPPVYVNHGFIMSSDSWFFQPGTRNLAFKLADAGFDVWVSNARGTTYSLGHESYNYDNDLRYWDFSFHELGIYDVPAVTKKILSESGYKKLWYVGYSMGTTQFFISLSELPEMNDKIIAAFLLSPVAFMGHSINIARGLAYLVDSEETLKVVNDLTNGRVPSVKEIRDHFKISLAEICDVSALTCGLCDNLWFMIFGYNPHQMNKTELPNIYAKVPNSASIKTLSHFVQLVKSCKFQKYNYSPERNFVEYGSVFPPEYQLGNIKVPLYFYHAEMDIFTVPLDVNIIASHLRKGVLKKKYKVKDYYFTHTDFMVGKDADKIVYNRVLKDMNKYVKR